ncbi:hypothetical protein [Paraburkholderia aspalathi]|uniref:Uncharacterized protein n=1 Tax=Paraburkholderia aspalathi TaxID=1324617 RepID=A0A1I7B6P5_9BURK|nr:hypothetical protein [Paraburkholderia aspalathi]SFT82812.1 hypothetical protein SAMN05192563_1004223 [Paraburkholderia aspalathi]
MSTRVSYTHPIGHEPLATALVDELAAARRARPTQHVRPAATSRPNCHDAVDAWIAAHAGTQAVRGWLALELDGSVRFAAHSLVRNADDMLIDPTFTAGEPALLFVPHPPAIGGFFSLLCRPGAPYELVVFTRDDDMLPN